MGRMFVCLAGTTVLATMLASTGCSIVGWKYSYRGQQYTMTKPNSDYHEHAIRDVRTRYGDPLAQEDVAKLKGACELLQKYAAEAPDPGSFTPARDLLDAEAHTTCAKWHAAEDVEETKLANQRRQQEFQQRQDEARLAYEARERQRESERQEQQRQQLAAMIQRDSQTVEQCNATESVRTARRRHAEILRNDPGATVRKLCTPRMEMQAVKSECKDANGFTRSCTKSVATGDVASYACPKTVDPEIVQLGLYQLNMLDSYPYPEERSLRVSDQLCDDAQGRLKQAREKLDGTASPSVGASL